MSTYQVLIYEGRDPGLIKVCTKSQDEGSCTIHMSISEYQKSPVFNAMIAPDTSWKEQRHSISTIKEHHCQTSTKKT